MLQLLDTVDLFKCGIINFGGNKMKNIGFLINEVEGDYFEELLKGVHSSAKKNNVNLVVFVGKPLQSPDLYEFSHNVTYKYAEKGLDGIIISAGSMSKHVSCEYLNDFFQKYDIPSVSISVKNGVSVGIDNKTGIKQIINHLVKVHKKRNIAFICGPEYHLEAIERLAAYKEALEENNIVFNNELVLKGGFSYHNAYSSIEELINKGIPFDAVVSTNDEMAIAVIKALNNKGIKVPEDIPVTGFDNANSAIVANLTTVRQPIYELGFLAMEELLGLMDNKINSGEFKVLPTSLIIRHSCGCNFNNPFASIQPLEVACDTQEFIDNFFESLKKYNLNTDIEIFRKFIVGLINCLTNPDAYNELNNYYKSIVLNMKLEDLYIFNVILQRLKNSLDKFSFPSVLMEKYFLDFVSILLPVIQSKNFEKNRIDLDSVSNIRNVLLNMLSVMNNKRDQLGQLAFQLSKMGVNSCYLFFYDKEIHNDNFAIPEYVNMYTNNRVISVIKTENMLREVFKSLGARSTFITFPLIFNSEQLGIIMYEYNKVVFDNSVLETLTVEISCALKISFLLEERKRIEDRLLSTFNELRELNDKLNFLSITDELTGLYNRRGFVNLSQSSLDLAIKRNQKGYLFFADMDGLKAINDNYGHDEGDNAIKEMANILRLSFRHNDIIARLAGDEFTIFTITVENFNENVIVDRIKDLTDKYNSTSGKPYKISISIGSVHFQSNNNVNIITLMNQADALLYEQKRKKKLLSSGNEKAVDL